MLSLNLKQSTATYKKLKKNLNLAIILDNLDPREGGKYAYQISLINKLKNIDLDYLNISFFYFNSLKKPINISDSEKLFKINYSFLKKIIDLILSKLFRILNLNYFSFIDNFFLKKNIDLIYFITPNHMALYIYNIHMINTVWDLFHMNGLEFPQTSSFIAYNLRDRMLKKTLPRSIAIACDSLQTIKILSKKYSIDEQRCFKLEYKVPEYLSEKPNKNISKIQNFNLNQKYIFYPSQLWPHKNHAYVLEALKIYNSNNDEIFFLFCGSDKGNLEYIRKISNDLGVDNNIIYLNFIDQQELIALYKNALALVMPTFELPTNIPPLEALYLECPIIYSKSEANNELFFRDALWEVDLNNPEDLSKTIAEIKNNKNDIVIQKVKLGKSLLKYLDGDSDKVILNKIFTNYLSKIKTYK